MFLLLINIVASLTTFRRTTVRQPPCISSQVSQQPLRHLPRLPPRPVRPSHLNNQPLLLRPSVLRLHRPLPLLLPFTTLSQHPPMVQERRWMRVVLRMPPRCPSSRYHPPLLLLQQLQLPPLIGEFLISMILSFLEKLVSTVQWLQSSSARNVRLSSLDAAQFALVFLANPKPVCSLVPRC